MKPDKPTRHRMLRRLIAERAIGTQDELVRAFLDEGIAVTQATISRDLRELGITKIATDPPRFALPEVRGEQTDDRLNDRLMRVFAEAVTGSAPAMNLLVIHTLPGMASATGSALDAMGLPDVAGTVCGDDTIFVACTDPDAALALQARLIAYQRTLAEPQRTEDA